MFCVLLKVVVCCYVGFFFCYYVLFMIEICVVCYFDDVVVVEGIFCEYVVSLIVSFEFQDYEFEIVVLFGKYVVLCGWLLFVWCGECVVGCVVFCEIDLVICEMKCVYVWFEVCGLNVGCQFVEWLLYDVKVVGYVCMCVDVLFEFVVVW